ncbi:hypothetical protein [Streptomyces sp. NRRL WC-3742]|uniref:hypothetical protein n=1 Tax=Streptomyces sp. NRRL WC-3742 TaxID=1463934 RepID=UPI0004C4CF36|nr:hypothetical protein [Streptomyces sp. NRRL WC-3742]
MDIALDPSRLGLGHVIGVSTESKHSTVKVTTSFVLSPLESYRPESGVETVGVVCGRCGTKVEVSVASPEVAFGRRRRRIMALRAGLMATVGGFVLAAAIGGTGDSPVAGWIGTFSLLSLLHTFVHLVPMVKYEFGVWLSGSQPVAVREAHLISVLPANHPSFSGRRE